MKCSWTKLVDDYLSYKRKLGFELSTDAIQLFDFAAFAQEFGTEGRLTVDLCVRWAQASRRKDPYAWERRIEVVRGFAKYLRRTDERSEVPPLGMFAANRRRLIPHIFTEEELETLLSATAGLTPRNGMRPVTCRAVFGLLSATGLRIGEALQLRTADVDVVNGVLKIPGAKRHHPRLIPIHPTVAAALQSYSTLRDGMIPQAGSDHFFLWENGMPANQRGMLYALRDLCQKLGWQPRGDYPHHRLHDFRHTFIVRVALRAHEAGKDVDKQILALSAYVGHVNVADTYWYFTGVPDLMSIAAQRFEDYAQGGGE